jgi:hypothetical protein
VVDKLRKGPRKQVRVQVLVEIRIDLNLRSPARFLSRVASGVHLTVESAGHDERRRYTLGAKRRAGALGLAPAEIGQPIVIVAKQICLAVSKQKDPTHRRHPKRNAPQIWRRQSTPMLDRQSSILACPVLA